MTIKQVIDSDCQVPENAEMLQKALQKIKPLSKYSEEVPQWAIEKVIHSMCHKYKVWVKEIAQDPWSNAKFDIWRSTVVEDGLDKVSELWKIKPVFGATIYEVLAKTALLIYCLVKSGKAGVRSEGENLH